MKKKLFLLTLLLLSSCQKDNSSLITVFKCQSEETLPVKITSQELDNFKNIKYSFPLFVYGQGCNSCEFLSSFFFEYVKKNQVFFPYMELSSYQSSKNSLKIEETSILFYEKGVVKDYKSDFSNIGSTNDLTALFNEYLSISSSYIINDLKIDDKEIKKFSEARQTERC